MNQTENRTTNLPKRVRNHVNPLADQGVTVFDGFSDTKPIMMDIGAYRGEFSEQLIGRFSKTHNFIVTEIRKPYANYLRELFTKHLNVRVFDGDSARNITNLLSSSTKKGVLIDYIFINFPDPWFKEKHKKRRVLNIDFLDQLSKIITADTKIVFQTDQENLFLESIELAQNHGKYKIEYFDDSMWGIESYWEHMKIKEGSTIRRMVLQRI